MPKYETMLVTSVTLDDEAAAALIGKFKDLIAKHGTIEAVDEWGRRRLAYPIHKEIDGVYTLIHFESGPDFPAELDRVYRITDGVLRSLIIAKQPGEELPQPKTGAAAPAAVAEEAKAEAPEAAAVVEEAKAEAPEAAAVVEEAKAEAPEAAAVVEEAKAEAPEAAAVVEEAKAEAPEAAAVVEEAKAPAEAASEEA